MYASRTLLFGTNDRLALNFGILVAWIVVGTAIISLFVGYFMRWKAVREKRRAATAAASESEKKARAEEKKEEPRKVTRDLRSKTWHMVHHFMGISA